MKNALQIPQVPLYHNIHTAQQHAVGGNHCVITQTTAHIQAPEPPATPTAAQPLIFAAFVVGSKQ